ncbi:telomere length and silencing protein 1 homolog [Folsomia candida]|uniref:Telomere length and silencing protein 1 n=1 Tax=Folsomia candida TaxID=158441 RepID=A0A226E342_FOLCA|nr:telomere length and silencing protein 1 homolog [Folsomia candida]OXA52155.1 hypothetical protein Fcan01_13021 [Folsomia candida]
MSTEEPDQNIVMFKRKSKKNLRQRRTEEDEAAENLEDADLTEKVELYKELRKLREKKSGTSHVTLALGKKTNMEEEIITSNTDPFKSGTGGMVDMAALNSGKYSMDTDDAYATGIGTQFSAETNTRDEDAEMLKYIENKLQEYKKSTAKGGSSAYDDATLIAKFLSPEEAALLAVPEHLRKSTGSNKSEEMLSNQMLSGIPEIDLGIEVKIKNIEATEEAKQKIIRDRMSKKEMPSHFVPTNMAVNFVQHNRFNIEDPTGSAAKRPKKEKEPEKPKKVVVVVGAQPEEVGTESVQKEKGTEKASDDFHFEKFKKQFRRF